MLIIKGSSLCSKMVNPQKGGFCHLSLYLKNGFKQTNKKKNNKKPA